MNFQLTKQLQNVDKPKDNLILDFHYESLDEFIQKYKYVMVYFNDVQTRWGKKNQKKYIAVADQMKTTEIIFLQIRTNQLNDTVLQKYKNKFPSRLNFYIYSFRKSFHQKINEDELINWLTNMYTSQVVQYESVEKLQGEINFTYINQKWYEKNQVHIDILAKLVFPVKIFTNFPQEILDLLKVDEEKPLWLLQSYSNKIIPIDIKLDINDKASFIIQNEFPNYMYADENNYRILFDLKIPSAIYFTKQIKNDRRLTVLKKIAKKYKEYFLLTIVETKKKNFESKFLKKFMGIKKTPQLRILNMTDKVQRYKFHGKYKATLIDNFFYNYIHENLKPFKLNQSIQYGEKLYGVLKANHKMFQKMLKDEDITYVIFVYGQDTKYLVRQLEELDIVQDILRKNKTLKFYCIDHDQNDLDGYYNDQLPFLFIADRLGKLHHYEESKFQADKMLVFINSKLPYLENSDPSFEFASGELQLIFLMKILISFEFGSYSTKISYFTDSLQKKIKTIEYKNIILFQTSNKVLIGDQAFQKLLSNKKKYQNSFCQNFTQNIFIQNGKYFDDQERQFTITDNLQANNIMFFPDLQLEISLKKIFIIFLKEIKKKLLAIFKEDSQVQFITTVLINNKDSIYQQNTLQYCFQKSGFKNIQFCLKSHALSFQYQISNNMISNKRVLFCDIGNSSINFYISKINVKQINVEKEFYFNRGLKYFDLILLIQIVKDIQKKCKEDLSQNQFSQFLLFEKIQQLKKSFSVNSEILFNLEEIFDKNFQNQFVKISKEIYLKLNESLLKEFDSFIKEVIDYINKFNLFIQDVQIVGGGCSLEIFQSLIQNKFENKYIFDKLNKYYSVSQGGCYYDKFKDKILFRNNKNILICIQEGDKIISEQVLYKKNDIIDVKQKQIMINLPQKLNKNQMLYIKYKKVDKKTNQNKICEIKQFQTKNIEIIHNGYLLFEQLIQGDDQQDIKIIQKFQEFNLSIVSQSKSEQHFNEKLLFNTSQTKEDTLSQKHSCHSKHQCQSKHSCHSKNQCQSQHSCHSHSTTHSHDQKNSLFSSAQMHIMSDFIQDIFLFVLSFTILFNPKLSFLDSFFSILVSIFIIYFVGKYTFQLFEKLLEITPAEINYNQILNNLLQIQGVLEIHDLHVWELGTMKYASSVHLVANKKHKRILKEATKIFRKYKIYHSTVQMESPLGKKDELYINCENNIHVK